MRHQWYADGRDLIKWGVLLHLAKSSNLERIIQVAYLRPDASRPVIERRNERQIEEIRLPDIVWTHFRNLRDIEYLAAESGVEIVLIETPYLPAARADYSKAIIDKYLAIPRKPMIVFLDPDTGIAKGRAKPEHVTSDEISEIWAALAPSDWLVLYQHKNFQQNWLSNKREEFARALGSLVGDVDVFRAKNGARDVAFLCAQKL